MTHQFQQPCNELAITENTVAALDRVLQHNLDKKVSVVGTMCTGKSTYLDLLGYGIELRDAAPKITAEQHEYLYGSEWSEEVGEKVIEWRGKHAQLQVGVPVFGTILVPGAEVGVYLKIEDSLLEQRVNKRGECLASALRMRRWIEEKILCSEIAIEIIEVQDD